MTEQHAMTCLISQTEVTCQVVSSLHQCRYVPMGNPCPWEAILSFTRFCICMNTKDFTCSCQPRLMMCVVSWVAPHTDVMKLGAEHQQQNAMFMNNRMQCSATLQIIPYESYYKLSRHTAWDASTCADQTQTLIDEYKATQSYIILVKAYRYVSVLNVLELQNCTLQNNHYSTCMGEPIGAKLHDLFQQLLSNAVESKAFMIKLQRRLTNLARAPVSNRRHWAVAALMQGLTSVNAAAQNSLWILK